MTDVHETLDNEVLRLRGTGRAFTRISRQLGLGTPTDAHNAFQRAFRRLPAGERDQVRKAELSRLNRLAAKVKGDSTRSADKQARQLQTIDRLRALVAEEP